MGVAAFVEWARKQGFSVKFGRTAKGGLLDTEDKSILINSQLSPENQFYSLVHEGGPILIGEREKDQRFGMGYNADEPNEKKTLVHRIDVVDEEFEAWDRGRKLARRLGVRVDQKRFQQHRAAYIKTYMKWALKVDGHGGPLDDSSET